MPQLLTQPVGPFPSGVITGLDPTAVPQGAALDVLNAAIDPAGVVVGIFGPGTADTNILQSMRFLHYHPGAGWLHDSVLSNNGYLNWAMRDADHNGQAVSYVTRTTPAIAFQVPYVYIGATGAPLGLVAPTVAPTNAGGAGANVTTRYTYVIEEGGVAVKESNPSPYSAPHVTGGTLSAAESADARVTHVYFYRTKDGDPNGIQYRVGKAVRVVGAATTLNTAGLAIDPGWALDWGPGGTPSDDLVVSDHSPAALLTCLSDKLHGAEASSSADAGGTAFAAIGSNAVWAQTGNPWYWPLRNTYPLPSIVQAIRSMGVTTYYFLEDQIWAASGAHSSAIAWGQTASRLGVMVRCGRTVQATPYGIFFLSNEGPAVFDGTSSRLLVGSRMAQVNFRQADASDIWVGAWFRGSYYLAQRHGAWRFDCRNWPEVTVSRVDYLYTQAFAEIPAGVISMDKPPGLYFAAYDNVFLSTGRMLNFGDVMRFSPTETQPGDVAGAVQLDATVRTGLLSFGMPERFKRAQELSVDGKGPLTFRFFCDDIFNGANAPVYTLNVAEAAAVRTYKLPVTVEGSFFQVEVVVPAGSTFRHATLKAVAK